MPALKPFTGANGVALKCFGGDIDIYSEYTGTMTRELFAGSGLETNMGLILQGAIPAALLAQGLFELAERWIVPKGLQVKSR
jgi:hypothetical protein